LFNKTRGFKRFQIVSSSVLSHRIVAAHEAVGRGAAGGVDPLAHSCAH